MVAEDWVFDGFHLEYQSFLSSAAGVEDAGVGISETGLSIGCHDEAIEEELVGNLPCSTGGVMGTA